MPGPHPPTRPQRSAALDGLRGFAAVAVIFYHTVLVTDPTLEPTLLTQGIQAQHTPDRILLKLFLAICNGEVAVDIFFVISGIVLFRALGAMPGPPQGTSLGIAWRFLLRRLCRILPVLAICLLAMFAPARS